MDIRTEMEFWTRILRDHGEFQYTSLAPKESDAIEASKSFMELFEQLHKEVKALNVGIQPQAVLDLISRNKVAVMQFVEFKKMMMKDLLKCDIELAMEPTFLNHMINEAMEYYRILNIADKTVPFNQALENIRLHKVWLPDASGHAKFLASQLDAIEANYINIALDFMHVFDKLFKKAFEMYIMYERTELEDGILDQFNLEVELVMNDFVNFLEELETLKKSCKVLTTGTTSSLVPNHMIREEKYYLNKIKNLG